MTQKLFEFEGYRARLREDVKPRFADDPCFSVEWTITHGGQAVGAMYEGPAYPGRVWCSMSKLVWSGEIPDGASDPKSPNYGICFDIGPRDSHEEALRAFVAAAKRLRAWRARNQDEV